MFQSQDLHITMYPEAKTSGMLTGSMSPGVKIVHIPTGVSVVCDSERSQFLNREIALKQLEAKIIMEASSPRHVADG